MPRTLQMTEMTAEDRGRERVQGERERGREESPRLLCAAPCLCIQLNSVLPLSIQSLSALRISLLPSLHSVSPPSFITLPLPLPSVIIISLLSSASASGQCRHTALSLALSSILHMLLPSLAQSTALLSSLRLHRSLTCCALPLLLRPSMQTATIMRRWPAMLSRSV